MSRASGLSPSAHARKSTSAPATSKTAATASSARRPVGIGQGTHVAKLGSFDQKLDCSEGSTPIQSISQEDALIASRDSTSPAREREARGPIDPVRPGKGPGRSTGLNVLVGWVGPPSCHLRLPLTIFVRHGPLALGWKST
jgi:hypothetical protein